MNYIRNHTLVKSGFTIVELIIVVVVIAIITSVVIVGYAGVQQRARDTALASDLTQAADKIKIFSATNGGNYPDTLQDADISDSDTTTYQYTSNNTTNPRQFCLTATYNRTNSDYLSATTGGSIQDGICPGHNTIVWYESVAGAATPVPSGAVDTSVFRGGNRSIRIGPSSTGLGIRSTPLSVAQGQAVTVSLWMRTDATWNGTGGNSKIRFGNQSGGALLNACGYAGVKASWTFVTCTYTVAAGISQLSMTVGNDGTTGNIWLDDISVSSIGP